MIVSGQMAYNEQLNLGLISAGLASHSAPARPTVDPTAWRCVACGFASRSGDAISDHVMYSCGLVVRPDLYVEARARYVAVLARPRRLGGRRKPTENQISEVMRTET